MGAGGNDLQAEQRSRTVAPSLTHSQRSHAVTKSRSHEVTQSRSHAVTKSRSHLSLLLPSLTVAAGGVSRSFRNFARARACVCVCVRACERACPKELTRELAHSELTHSLSANSRTDQTMQDTSTHTKSIQTTTNHIGRQADRQTGRQADRQTGRQADRQTGRQADRQTGRQADRQTGRQADRQTGRQQTVKAN